VVITGDLVNTSSPDALAQLDQVIQALPRGVPLVCCSGNVDSADVMTWIRQRNTVPPAEGDLVVIPIDCAPGGAPSLEEGSIENARTALQAVPVSSHVSLAIHHPPGPRHGSIGDQLLLRDTTQLAELAAHRAVVGIVAGHTHTATVSTFDSKPLLVAPGVRSEGRLPHLEVVAYGDPLVDESTNPAYLLHRVTDRTITTYVRQVSIASPKNTIGAVAAGLRQ